MQLVQCPQLVKHRPDLLASPPTYQMLQEGLQVAKACSVWQRIVRVLGFPGGPTLLSACTEQIGSQQGLSRALGWRSLRVLPRARYQVPSFSDPFPLEPQSHRLLSLTLHLFNFQSTSLRLNDVSLLKITQCV